MVGSNILDTFYYNPTSFEGRGRKEEEGLS